MASNVRGSTLSFGLASLLAIIIGGATGALVPVVMQLETRWMIYILAGALFATVFILSHNKNRFLWGSLVLSLQVAVYLRFLFDYAGSEGIAIAMPTLVALACFGWFTVSRTVPITDIDWRGPMAKPIYFFLATCLLSWPFSKEQFVGLTAIANYAQYLLIYLLALNFVTTEQRLRHTMNLLAVVLAIQSIIYCAQSALGITFTLTGEVLSTGEVPRPGGTISTRPAAYASFVLPLIAICAARFVAGHTTLRLTMAAGLPAMLGMITIVLTYTRAAWGSLVIALACVTFLSYRRGLLSVSKVSALAVVGCVMAIASAPMIAARFAEAPLDDSLDERVALMQMAVEVIKSEPLVGVGPGAYPYQFKSYLTPDLRDYWLRTVHNQYLLQTAETGLVGGLAFVVMLIAGFLLALRLSRDDLLTVRVIGIGCTAGIAALCFEMYWDIWTGYPFNAMLWFLFGVMGAATGISRRRLQAD